MRTGGIILKDEIVKEIYQKRKEISKLEEIINPLIKETKDAFLDSNTIYASTKEFNVMLRNMYRCNDDFVLLLQENNLTRFITSQCTSENFKKASEILKIKPNDEKYRNLYQRHLLIRKK